MKKIVRGLLISVLFLGIGYALLTGRLVALAYWTLYANNELLTQQLHGNGCWFHYDLDQDGECEFEWSFFDRTVRNPEFHCPMRAAFCIAKKPGVTAALISELKAIKLSMPDTFDTGDGIIRYRECIEGAIRAVETPLVRYEFDSALSACSS